MVSQAPAKKPTSSLNTSSRQKKILRIGIVQNGRIVEEKLLRKRGDISIGRGADNTFLIPSRDLPRSFKIFEETRSGYVLNFVKGMDARVAVDGKIMTLNQILERGEFVKKGTDYYKLDLSHSSRGKLVIGEITVLFHFVVPPPEMPRPQLPHVMWGMYAVRSYLGAAFMASVFACVFVFTPLLIWLLLNNYDPNWEPPKEDAQKIVARAISRSEALQDKPPVDPQEATGDAGDGEGDTGAEEKAEEKPTTSTKPSDDGKESGPVTEDNAAEKAAKIAAAVGDIKVDLSGIPKELGAIPSGVQLPNLSGAITAIPVGTPGGPSVGPITASSGLTTLQADGPCSGPTCTVASGRAIDPNKIGDESRHGGPGGPGGTGTGGPGVPGRIGTPNVGNLNIGPIKVDAPATIPPVNIPMIEIMTPTSMVEQVVMADMPAPDMKPARPTSRASGLLPPGAPADARKVLQGFPFTIGSCFQQASAMGLVGSSGDISVSVTASGGKISVTNLGGSLAGNDTVASCVRSRLNNRSLGKSEEAQAWSHSWTFSVQLVGATTN